MTPEQLAAIERLRELEKKATPGEWVYQESVCGVLLPPRKKLPANQQQIKIYPAHDSSFTAQNKENLNFIATLRNDGMPLIEALQAENERLRADIAKAVKHLQRNMSDDRLYALIELEALNDA